MSGSMGDYNCDFCGAGWAGAENIKDGKDWCGDCKRWTRSNKAELAAKIRELLTAGMRPKEIAETIGKSQRRILQIRKLFSLPDWARSGRVECGKLPPQES